MPVRHQDRWEEARKVFNRYLLPKVAFTIITVASAVGAYLAIDGDGPVSLAAVVHWAFLLSLGLTTGALAWNALYAQPAAAMPDGSAADAYLVRQRQVFRRAQRWLLPVLAVAGILDLAVRGLLQASSPAGFGAAAAALLMLAVLVAAEATRRGSAEEALSATDRLSVGAALLLAVVAGWPEVLARHGVNGVQLGVRSLHLLAFSLWYGGAFWNIFVAVPAAGREADFAVVAAANLQLERFRWVVRFVFPTIFLTGLLQVYGYVGLHYEVLFISAFGRLVLLKLGLIAALVGVFITCPMWRACSPIRGVCNIDDLKADDPLALPLHMPAD